MKKFIQKLGAFCLMASMLLHLTACSLSEGDKETSRGASSLVEAGSFPEMDSDTNDLSGHREDPKVKQEMPGNGGNEIESWRYRPFTSEEEYDSSGESPFKDTAASPLSTFSSDVDTASYSNMRRMILQGSAPKGVRVEELINYFDYGYEKPAKGSETPFSIITEVSDCPWEPSHQLAMVAVQGKSMEPDVSMKNNIVFLIDTSGSMGDTNKLPLLKESFQLLLGQLGENDTISIVTYAGTDQVLADSIQGNRQKELQEIIDSLSAEGTTAGAQGLRKAYALAEKNWIEGGNNRIILATDGDFNVGESSTESLTQLIEKEREKGIFISVLGFGMGNLKDNKMELIADKGNGNYAYIDNMREAQKVMVNEFDSTLYTIAKDVKFQVEFNPAVVSQYRLIGYNNRRMENEDFNNDQKDAGDVGAGHSVTAFYELIPVGEKGEASVDSLQYQGRVNFGSTDYMHVKVRYKEPNGNESKLVEKAIPRSADQKEPSEAFGFASAVAEMGLILTHSEYKGSASMDDVIKRSQKYRGSDTYGLRQEFTELAKTYQQQSL